MIGIKDSQFAPYEGNDLIFLYELPAHQAKGFIKDIAPDDTVVLLKLIKDQRVDESIIADFQALQEKLLNEGKIVVEIEDTTLSI